MVWYQDYIDKLDSYIGILISQEYFCNLFDQSCRYVFFNVDRGEQEREM